KNQFYCNKHCTQETILKALGLPTEPAARADSRARKEERHDEPVDGAELLDELRDLFARYLFADEHAYTTLALYSLLTHTYDVFDICPLLSLTSPAKRCGKTTAETLLSAVVHQPVPASNISAPVAYRVIADLAPTLIIDEADSFLNNNEEL